MQNVHLKEIELTNLYNCPNQKRPKLANHIEIKSLNTFTEIEMGTFGIQEVLLEEEEKSPELETTPKASRETNFLEEVNQSYSAESTKNLEVNLAEDFNLEFDDFLELAGPVVAAGIWVFLKICPLDTRKNFLRTISQFRNTVKSMRTIGQTTEASGAFNNVNFPVGNCVGSALGLILAAFMTLEINPKIIILEERLQRRIELNRLLKKHLETSLFIPQDLCELQLLQWLRDTSQFPELPRRQIKETDFADFNQEDAVTLSRLKMMADIINGIYFVSVIRSDLDFIGIGKFITNPVSLAINTLVGTALIVNSYQISKHQTEGTLLQVKQSSLSGKLDLLKSTPAIPIAKKEAMQEQLCECENKIQAHQKINFNNTQLASAGLRGYLESSETINLIAEIPLLILGLAHFVSASCPPVYLAVLGVTIAVGLYVAYQRYQRQKQELEKNGMLNNPKAKEELPKEIEMQSLAEEKTMPAKVRVATSIKNPKVSAIPSHRELSLCDGDSSFHAMGCANAQNINKNSGSHSWAGIAAKPSNFLSRFWNKRPQDKAPSFTGPTHEKRERSLLLQI